MGGFVGVNGSIAGEGTEDMELELAFEEAGGPMEDVVAPLRLVLAGVGVWGGGGT